MPGELVPVDAWPSVGIWRTGGVPDVLCEGTGEANRAVDVARGTGLPGRRPLKEL